MSIEKKILLILLLVSNGHCTQSLSTQNLIFNLKVKDFYGPFCRGCQKLLTEQEKCSVRKKSRCELFNIKSRTSFSLAFYNLPNCKQVIMPHDSFPALFSTIASTVCIIGANQLIFN